MGIQVEGLAKAFGAPRLWKYVMPAIVVGVVGIR